MEVWAKEVGLGRYAQVLAMLYNSAVRADAIGLIDKPLYSRVYT